MRGLRSIVIGALVVVGTTIVVYLATRSPEVAPPSAPNPLKLPAPTPLPTPASATEFSVTTETSNVNGRRHILLRAGDAAALLKLSAPTDYAGENASGRVSLEAPSGDQGARFIEDISLWMKAPKPPATEPSPLHPLYGTYVRQLTDGGAEHLRLHFSRGASRAEVALRLSADGTRGVIAEVAPELRQMLIDLMAGALRDGFGRRTPATDANFDDAEPNWSEFQPLGGDTNGSNMQAWPVRGGAWGAINSGNITSIVWWENLQKQPTELARLEGVVTTLAPSPKGKRAVVAVVKPSRQYPSNTRGFESDDPTSLVVIDPSKAQPIVLVPPGQRIDFRPMISWSPLGTAVAAECENHTIRGNEQQIRVFDTATGAEVGATTPSARTLLQDWTAQGLLFASVTDSESGESTFNRYRWSPSGGTPERVSDSYVLRSPDGKYGFALAQGAVEIASPHGMEPFPTIYADDRKALEYAAAVRPWWLGGHQLLLVSDDLLVLDLSSRKLRYAFPANRSLLLQGVSPDGDVVFVRDEDDRILWSAHRK